LSNYFPSPCRLRTKVVEGRIACPYHGSKYDGDECIGACRRHLKAWERRGWRIDRKRLRETTGDIACAVPGPARRHSKNWVLDPVPLMPAGD
jgi:hypothetical protein